MKKKETKKNELAFKMLNIDETKYKTLITKKFENRKVWKSYDPSLITTLIPGTVSKLFVKEGDTIIEGEKLLILEAMKMKNIITIPYSGFVKKVNVEEGQSIPKDYVMIEIDIQLSNEEKNKTAKL